MDNLLYIDNLYILYSYIYIVSSNIYINITLGKQKTLENNKRTRITLVECVCACVKFKFKLSHIYS